MKNLSLNIKKIALSLLVVGLAVGTQAFKNAEDSSRFSTTYYQTSEGNYVLTVPAAPNGRSCQSTSSNPCMIIFESNEIAEHVTQFTTAEIEDLEVTYGNSSGSGSNKLYLPNP